MAQDRHQNAQHNDAQHSVEADDQATPGRRPGPDVRPKTTGVRRNTSGARQNTSGARQNTSGARQNTSGARPKTSNIRRNAHGARPKASSPTQHDNASALLQTLNSDPVTSPAEDSTLSPAPERPLSRQHSSSRRLLKPRRLLESIPLPPDITQSPTVCAVEIHLRDDLANFAVTENQILLKTAIRAFLARTGHYPKAAELLEDIIDSDFREENIVKDFAEWGQRQFGGVENVPVFQRRTDSVRGSLGGKESSESSGQISHGASGEETSEVSSRSSCFEFQELDTAASSDENADKLSRAATDVTSQTHAPDEETYQILVLDETETKEGKDSREDVLKSQLKEVQPNTKLSLNERLERVLRREREYLRRRGMCLLCDKQADVTFLPCTHLVTCSACATGCTACPQCGGKILAEAKTFLL